MTERVCGAISLSKCFDIVRLGSILKSVTVLWSRVINCAVEGEEKTEVGHPERGVEGRPSTTKSLFLK